MTRAARRRRAALIAAAAAALMLVAALVAGLVWLRGATTLPAPVYPTSPASSAPRGR